MAYCVLRLDKDNAVKIMDWCLVDFDTNNAEVCSSRCVARFKKHFKNVIPDGNNVWVMIERQLPQNIKCMCLSHTVFTFFLTLYENINVSFVNAKDKPLEETGRKRKRECVNETAKFLEDDTRHKYINKGNGKWLAWFTAQKKKDDLADCFMQAIGNLDNVICQKNKRLQATVSNVIVLE